MQKKRLNKLNQWLEKKLNFPGCTDRQLHGNITVFETHVFLAIYALMFVIPFLFFAPQLSLIIQYAIIFFSLYFLSSSLQLFFPGRILVIHTCVSVAMHLITFYYIIQYGGISTSGGLIYAGISNVLTSIMLQRKWLPISMFSLWGVLVVLMVVLQPRLHVPDQMTPAINSILWLFNSIIITGSGLIFVLQFIRQQRKLEELETNHLKEINELKDRFFTNITHEFRTPLTIIEGMADLIKARPEQWMGTGLQKIKNQQQYPPATGEPDARPGKNRNRRRSREFSPSRHQQIPGLPGRTIQFGGSQKENRFKIFITGSPF